VLQYENKRRLIEAISKVKREHGTESTEDALMIMADPYV